MATIVFRSMRVYEHSPVVDESSTTLGARPIIDILVVDNHVWPQTGGLSVTPDDPQGLPQAMRPLEMGGLSRYPVWWLDTGDLPDDLTYRSDPCEPLTHGFVEPVSRMLFDDYQRLLWATRDSWHLLGTEK